MQARMMS